MKLRLKEFDYLEKRGMDKKDMVISEIERRVLQSGNSGFHIEIASYPKLVHNLKKKAK